MLETVSQGFRSARQYLQGQAQLSESNIEEALKQVRLSLLSADVDYSVTKSFLERVKQKAIGKTVVVNAKTSRGERSKLSPAEHFIGICYEELQALMGPVDTAIKLSKPVGTIMMIGLQGSGKTTTTAKLAAYLQKKQLKPLLVAADIYRPAAIDQLKTLGAQLDVPVFADPTLKPPQLCAAAIQKAKERQCNVVIFDTAGRLAVDDALMTELEQIKQLTKPDNIFLVVDSMIGQDAVKTAAEFDRRIGIDGFILTKLDGDARGGAALSIKEVTHKPIKFLGMGEKLTNLEEFRPEGLASRILGMGDVVGLVKDFEEHVDQEKAERDAERMLQGQFSLDDFVDQLRMIRRMGPIGDIIEKLPGMGEALGGQKVDEREFVKLEAIVSSMTKKERKNPSLIEKQKSRRKRIALGSGRKENEVDALLKRFTMMRQMMQAIGSQPSLLGRLPGFKQLGQMKQLAQNYGGADMQKMFAQMGDMQRGPMGIKMPPGYFTPPKDSISPQALRDRKEKRKKQKEARKKNKKKKK